MYKYTTAGIMLYGKIKNTVYTEMYTTAGIML
jgi:hypothetical protein